jgi:bifunctional DNA-binding transcriptional regulator/antitoxin component of YhaV-PrlF toxin-antitoxin module
VSVGKLDTDDIVCIEETTVTVRSYRHRTTVPSKIFRLLDLKQGDSLRWIAIKDGTVYIRKVQEPASLKRE